MILKNKKLNEAGQIRRTDEQFEQQSGKKKKKRRESERFLEQNTHLTSEVGMAGEGKLGPEKGFGSFMDSKGRKKRGKGVRGHHDFIGKGKGCLV